MIEREAALQYDMFTGQLVDNRTSAQKAADKERSEPRQQEMFPQREIAQFGVRAHRYFSLSPHTRLMLVSEDPRTEEEKERDIQKAAEALTTPLFAEPAQATKTPVVNLPAPSKSFPELPTRVHVKQVREGLYFRLITLVEQLQRESPTSTLPFALTLCAAQEYGLTQSEIQCAVQIGERKLPQAKLSEIKVTQPPPPPEPSGSSADETVAVEAALVHGLYRLNGRYPHSI
jgi:hypothetical protein